MKAKEDMFIHIQHCPTKKILPNLIHKIPVMKEMFFPLPKIPRSLYYYYYYYYYHHHHHHHHHPYDPISSGILIHMKSTNVIIFFRWKYSLFRALFSSRYLSRLRYFWSCKWILGRRKLEKRFAWPRNVRSKCQTSTCNLFIVILKLTVGITA